MKFGKVNKDGSINMTVDSEEDKLLYDNKTIVAFLNDIVNSCPEVTCFRNTNETRSKRVYLPPKLFSKIQAIGILNILKKQIARGECTTKRIVTDTAKEILVSPNQVSKETKNMTNNTQVGTSTLTYARAKVLVRKSGIRNIQKYVSLRTKGQLPSGLPSDPKATYARYWKGWNEFCGTVAK